MESVYCHRAETDLKDCEVEVGEEGLKCCSPANREESIKYQSLLSPIKVQLLVLLVVGNINYFYFAMRTESFDT